jgi:hypothetical protein
MALDWARQIAVPDEDPQLTVKRAVVYYLFLIDPLVGETNGETQTERAVA